TCPRARKTRAACATAASGRPPPNSHACAEGRRRARARARAWCAGGCAVVVAARRARRARGRAASADARAAELLVRRGVHRGARGGQPAVRLVLAGGACLLAVRVRDLARDALLPARPRGPLTRPHGGVRGQRLAGAGDALLLGLPARADGAVAAARPRAPPGG